MPKRAIVAILILFAALPIAALAQPPAQTPSQAPAKPDVTPAEALAHPTWDMGPLVTKTSATLGVRRQQRSSDDAGESYKENAVAARLNMSF